MYTENSREGGWPEGFVFAFGTRFCPSEVLQQLLRAALLTEYLCVIIFFMWKIQIVGLLFSFSLKYNMVWFGRDLEGFSKVYVSSKRCSKTVFFKTVHLWVSNRWNLLVTSGKIPFSKTAITFSKM